MNKKVFLIDGSSFLYRAYYSMRPLHTSSGLAVQAVYGFVRMIKKIIDKQHPEHMILVWDSKGKTERHTIFPDYKATRQAPPSDLFEQKKIIQQFAQLIGLHQLEAPGIEADDLIYSAAKDLVAQHYDVVIISSDKDLYQMLSDKITILDPFKDIVVTKEAHEAALGYEVAKIPFYFAILGDSSDNIPGVKGIGKKGAEDLVKEFYSLEDLYTNIDRVKKEKTKLVLIEQKDNAFLSLQLFLLRYSPLNLNLEEVAFNKENWVKAFDLFKELQFKSLIQEIEKKEEIAPEPIIPFFEKRNTNLVCIQHAYELEKIAAEISEKKLVALDTETTGFDTFTDTCVGISLCMQVGTAYYIPLHHITLESQVSMDDINRILKPLLEDPAIKKVLQHAKFDALVLHKLGITLNNIFFDTMIAANLVTPDWQRIGLDKLSKHYLDDDMLTFDDVVKKFKHKNFAHVPLELATKYAASDAHQTFALMAILEKELQDKKLDTLFYEIEMPLMRILLAMQIEGIAVDKAILKQLELQIDVELQEIIAKIKALISDTESLEINLNSPKQVEELLFNVLKLPPQKKSTKRTGYSTDQEVLLALSLLHPVPGLILRYRELSKLQGTYVQGLPHYIKKDGKIHSSFSQTATATGRLASSDPNLQNIPADNSYYSKTLRSAFVAPEGYEFIAADYSQIELRVLAYLSQDKNLIEAFLQKKDIHTITASKIFDVSLEQVTHEQRQIGKRINFSILYGITPFGLSQDLGIPFGDAKKYIEKYFDEYPGVRTWMDSIVTTTHKQGYIETYWHRRRYIPMIYEKNKSLYEFAKRAAINTVAQGTAAEIMKIGMINLFNEFEKNSIDAKIVVQIHDELLICVNKNILNTTEQLVKNILESVTQWNVPLEISTKTGENWQEVSK